MVSFVAIRVMVKLGMISIPRRQAIISDADQIQNVHALVEHVAREMPLTNKKTLSLSTAFTAEAVEGCTCDENYVVLEKHIKEMCSEFKEIKKRKMVNR